MGKRKITTLVSADITRTKAKLNRIAKANGIYESFGQAKVLKLKDKYNYITMVYGTMEERQAAAQIDTFDNWCMNFSI